jgi:hypothetical protein
MINRQSPQWYTSLNWQRHYAIKRPDWLKALRKSDIVLSAMFKASRKQFPRVSCLLNVIGPPDWIEGGHRNGALYYKLYRGPGFPHYLYMMLDVRNGVIVDGGSNLMMYFKPHSAKRRPVWIASSLNNMLTRSIPCLNT